MGTPYIDRNFINSLPEAKVDQSESGFLQKTHLGYVPGPQIFFLDHSIIILAPKWVVFSRGGSLSEICGQNLRNVGRRAVVMITYYQYSLNMKRS